MKTIIAFILLIAGCYGCWAAEQNIFQVLWAGLICIPAWYLLMQLGEIITNRKNKKK